jgi:transcription-repair coupling factor (superfamily II helicase)
MTTPLFSLPHLHLDEAGTINLSSVPDGLIPPLLDAVARQAGGPVIHITRDGLRARAVEEALAFFAPQLPVLNLPPWDCLPYDRVSPSAAVVARRLSVLARLEAHRQARPAKPMLLITTVNAAVQKLPPPDVLAAHRIFARVAHCGRTLIAIGLQIGEHTFHGA